MKKQVLSVVAAAALVASLTVPAWAAVASPYGGAEAEGGDVTYTTQAQTGEDSQATQVYETIQGAESTEQELGLLGCWETAWPKRSRLSWAKPASTSTVPVRSAAWLFPARALRRSP